MGYMETYKEWCDNEYFDEATRAELKIDCRAMKMRFKTDFIRS